MSARSSRDAAEQAAEAWLDRYCAQEGIVDWDALPSSAQFAITRLVPCAIRCWRVGDAVVQVPGKACAECGKTAAVSP